MPNKQAASKKPGEPSSQPKILRPALPAYARQPKDKPAPGARSTKSGDKPTSSSSDDDENVFFDLSGLDIGQLKVVDVPGATSVRSTRDRNHVPVDKTPKDTMEKPNRRATLKKYLLKSQEARLAIDEVAKHPTSSTDPSRSHLSATSEADVNEGEEESSFSLSDCDANDEEVGENGAVSVMQKRLFSEKPKFICRRARGETLTSAAHERASSTEKAEVGSDASSAEQEKLAIMENKLKDKLVTKKEEQNRLALQLTAVSDAEAEAHQSRHRSDSLRLVVALSREEKRREEAERAAELAALPDDGDDGDAETAFEKWKLRELERLRAEVARRSRHEEEREEAMLRRAMDETQREEDNRRCGSRRYEKSEEKIQFLQKYFHKGVFFQDDAELVEKRLLSRNFMTPVGEDRYTDRTMLPKVMQVKDFGLASRTKYTHLVDQDTTFGKREFVAAAEKAPPVMGDFENPVNPWMDFRSAAHRRFRRVAGAEGFERPARRRPPAVPDALRGNN